MTPIVIGLLLVMFVAWLVFFRFRSSRWTFALWFPMTATAAIGTIGFLMAIGGAVLGGSMRDAGDGFYAIGVMMVGGMLLPFPIVFFISMKNRPMGKAWNLPAIITTVIGYGTLVGVLVFTAEMQRPRVDFYGKVVDESGNPMNDVGVEFVTTDKNGASQKREYYRRSDANGLFSLKGGRGSVLKVNVMGGKYYEVSGRAHYQLEYTDTGLVRQTYGKASSAQEVPTDPANPVLFTLRKKKEAERLIARGRNFKIIRDGTPVEVDLVSGKQVDFGEGHVRVECWISDDGVGGHNFSWRMRLSVADGGLLETTDQFQVEAPLEGYQQFIEDREVAKPMGERYRSGTSRKYYLKLRDGNYAFLDFYLETGGDCWFTLQYRLNPSGSRNLEYNQNKRINRE